jgi:Flp pilus assembly CpaE family ATPase
MLLTGITRPQRWTELRPESFVRVLEVAREVAEVVFVDCSSCVEQDEELFFDTMAPRRNGLTVATLGAADQVLMIASADPVGMQRAIRIGLSVPDELPGVSPEIVINRLRKASLPNGSSRDHVTGLVKRHLGRAPIAVIPSDRPACDKGLAAGRTLREVASGSPARAALRELSKRVVPEAERKWLRSRAG